jgi:hypothetical protein
MMSRRIALMELATVSAALAGLRSLFFHEPRVR